MILQVACQVFVFARLHGYLSATLMSVSVCLGSLAIVTHSEVKVYKVIFRYPSRLCLTVSLFLSFARRRCQVVLGSVISHVTQCVLEKICNDITLIRSDQES